MLMFGALIHTSFNLGNSSHISSKPLVLCLLPPLVGLETLESEVAGTWARAEVEAAVENVMGAAVEAVLEAAVETAVEAAVETAVGAAVETAVEAAVEARLVAGLVSGGMKSVV